MWFGWLNAEENEFVPGRYSGGSFHSFDESRFVLQHVIGRHYGQDGTRF
jgi:hypothetical protein